MICDAVPLPILGCDHALRACSAWEPSIAVAANPGRPGEETIVVAFIASDITSRPWRPSGRTNAGRLERSAGEMNGRSPPSPEGPSKRVSFAYGVRPGPGGPIRWSPGRALAPCENEEMVAAANASVAAGPDGVFYCAILLETHPISVRFFRSAYVGEELVFNQIGAHLAFDGKPWIVVDNSKGPGRGTVYLTFTHKEPGGACPLCQLTRSTDRGETWLPPVSLPYSLGAHTRMAIGPDSEVYVAGHTCSASRCPDGTGFRVLKSTNAYTREASFSEMCTPCPVSLGGEWTGVANGCPNGKNLGQIWIACDNSAGPFRGSLSLACSVDPPGADPMDVMFAWNRGDGSAWTSPVRLNGDNAEAWQWFGTMSMAPNGRIDVVWNESQNASCTTSQLMYAYRVAGKTSWSRPATITNSWTMGTGWHIGGYYHMVSDDAGADLAIARVDKGPCGVGRNVYYLRINARP